MLVRVILVLDLGVGWRHLDGMGLFGRHQEGCEGHLLVVLGHFWVDGLGWGICGVRRRHQRLGLRQRRIAVHGRPSALEGRRSAWSALGGRLVTLLHRFLTIVIQPFVPDEEVAARKALVAKLAGERLLLRVGPFVSLQMLQAGKHALTAMALEALWLLWRLFLGLLEQAVAVAWGRGWRLHPKSPDPDGAESTR